MRDNERETAMGNHLMLLSLLLCVSCQFEVNHRTTDENKEVELSEEINSLITEPERESSSEELSIGTLEDDQVYYIPPRARRFYFAGSHIQESVRPNVLGHEQVLYYDLYEPLTKSIGVTVINIHGGGYNVGHANYKDQSDHCELFNKLGAHCISVEYRRGWAPDLSSGASSQILTDEDLERALITTEMAKQDVLDAWRHLFDRRLELGVPNNFLLVGTSAGGSLASRISLTNTELSVEYKILGVIVGFGTHSVEEDVVIDNDIPVVIQGGLFDEVSPMFNNTPWFADSEVMIAKGMYNLYDELDEKGFKARLLISAQKGHGFGAYQDEQGLASHYESSMQFFLDVQNAKDVKANYVEYKFNQNDPFDSSILSGMTINTLDQPGFTYEPYESLLRDGLSPDEVLERLGSNK